MKIFNSHLPDVLVGEVSSAVSTGVQSAARVDVLVLPHVVGGGVMLPAHRADEPLLAVGKLPDAVALLLLILCRWGLDLVPADHVVGVVVRGVVVPNIITIRTRGSGSDGCNKTPLLSDSK